MSMGPRAKLLLIMTIFAMPMIASYTVYNLFPPGQSTNYGELLEPVPVAAHVFATPEGSTLRFEDLRGKWVMVVSDSGACPAACVEKLAAMRQVRLALGRNADRVARVLVADDLARPEARLLEPFAGTLLALTPVGLTLPPGAANDRAHIYLVDPRGYVMMRWPAAADRKQMLRDMGRLLKASQIG